MVTETFYREEAVEKSSSYNKILQSDQSKLLSYEKLEISEKEASISLDNEKKQKRKSDIINPNSIKRTKSETDSVDLTSDEVFSWQAYLKKTNSTAVPSTIFKHIIPECICGFQPGMKLEVPNKDYLNTYWLAYVIRKAAPLILVRYEGFDDSKADFWLNTLSDDIHPVGWCARNKQVLKPPKAIQHKETNWYQYLIKHLTGARKAAEHLFHKKSHPAHYLRAGQYVEVLDFFNPTCYWLARICETFSGRLSLQYEGFFEKEGELWCFYLSPNLRPVGHGLSHGLTLYPPKGCQSLTQPQLNKVIEKLLVLSNRTDNSVFKTLFKGLENLTPHGVFLGMKLEAIHPHDPSSICVASVSRIFDSYMFLVKIDNLISAQDEITDSFVAYRGSKKIFPVGFCSKNNISLIQPLGYNGKFTWEAYFKYTKSVSVPSDFFQESSLPENIEVGMKLEAVDQENLSNICVCTVSKVVGTHLWLNIDGDTRTDQIFSYDSHELFPVGWCEKTGHELQWPRPNTLEQKNRISSLRLTATRQTRLEVLRKGKYKVSEGKTETKKDQKHKGKSQNYLKGKRGFSRKRVNYDSDGNKSEIVDTSIAIVCINRLADEYNSEASIKKHFHLDSEGRLPAQVVTIDDDEEDDPITNDKLAAVSNFNESQLSFFSFIRLKPLKLNKKEEEEFNKKIKENDANQGTSSEELSPLRGMERRSLNNVVAMLRANRRSNRSQLIENYKCNKSKDEHQSSNQKKPSRIIESLEKEIPDEKEATSIDLPKNNKRCDQPNSVVTPSKENLESLSKEDVANKTQVAEQIAGVARSSSVSSTPRTNIEDMHMLSNMARSHSGLNEILRNRCNKIRMLCKDLPNNPLLWTKGEVAQFIKNASFQKYANLFYQQDVDGHSLLLLTVQEIHHILGIQLGPALKIHDYIFTLQELVNDAFLSNESQGGASKLTTVNNSSVVWDQARKIRDMSLPNNEAHSTHLEVVRWLNKSHEESASFSSTDVDEDILTVANKVASARGYQPRNFQISRPRFIQIKDVKSLGPRHPLRPQVRLLQPPQLIPEFSSGSAMNVKHIPEKKDDTQVISVQKSDHNRLPTMEISKKDLHSFSFQSYHNNLNLMPYLSNTAASSSSLSSKSCDFSEINFQERPNNVHMFKNILHVPQNLKRTFEKKLTSKPTEEPPLKIVKNKHLVSCASFTDMSNTSVNVQTPSKNLPPLTSGTIPLTSFPSEHPWFDKYLKNVQVELEGKELWEEFNELGTEMILTRAGRRMFPNLQVRISGMHPKALYVILVDFAPVDHHRYKFEYETSRWMIACEEFTPRPSRVYGHSDSPACGEIWMKNLVDFTKCKLTNNVHDDQGHILMHSMHKYQPRIHVLYWEGTLSLNIDPFELLRISCHKVFIFPETKFIAVTAYQNSQITQLKIAQNPFARGFRGDWRKATEVALVEVDQMKGNLLETFKYSTFSKENIFSHLNYKTKSPNEENTDAIVKHQTPKNAKNPQSSAGLITKTNIVHNIKEVKSVTPPIFSVKNEDIEKEAPTLVASQITDSNEISLKKEPV